MNTVAEVGDHMTILTQGAMRVQGDVLLVADYLASLTGGTWRLGASLQRPLGGVVDDIRDAGGTLADVRDATGSVQDVRQASGGLE